MDGFIIILSGHISVTLDFGYWIFKATEIVLDSRVKKDSQAACSMSDRSCHIFSQGQIKAI